MLFEPSSIRLLEGVGPPGLPQDEVCVTELIPNLALVWPYEPTFCSPLIGRSCMHHLLFFRCWAFHQRSDPPEEKLVVVCGMLWPAVRPTLSGACHAVTNLRTAACTPVTVNASRSSRGWHQLPGSARRSNVIDHAYGFTFFIRLCSRQCDCVTGHNAGHGRQGWHQLSVCVRDCIQGLYLGLTCLLTYMFGPVRQCQD